MAKDYYQILGIGKGASAEEIKQAFRKLAHKHHPDKHGGDEAKFKEINEAYQVLKDPTKRKQYDQFGSAAFENGGFGAGGPGFSGGFSGFGGAEDFGDIFGDLGDLFGFGGRGRGRRARGGDIQMDVDLEFKEAVFGTQKEITLTKPGACDRCAGTGAEPGSRMKTCPTCGGSGVEVTVQRTILGTFQQKRVCATCAGTGEVPQKPCSSCSGSGIKNARKTIRVSVPPGVENGTILRVRAEGEVVKGAEPGDLLVHLHVAPDERFEREGTTLYSIAKIGFTQAALGDTIEVDTLDGKADVKVPPGTQSGTQLRLKGKGVPTHGGRGDQIVLIEVVTPKKLTREQKKLMEDLDLKE